MSIWCPVIPAFSVIVLIEQTVDAIAVLPQEAVLAANGMNECVALAKEFLCQGSV